MMTNASIKMMIVDDEPLIIRSLKVALPWEDYGIEIVGEARNGELALQVFKESQPDIVLSDIRMPSVDGIELMKSLFELKPNIIFILISGYGEFHYAQIGLREGAFDYLLKPIDHDELDATIQKAIKHIKHLRAKQVEKEDLSLSLQHLAMLTRDGKYSDQVDQYNDVATVNSSKWLKQSKLERHYYMCLVSIDEYVKFQQVWTHEEQKLWFYIINNILEEIGEREGAISVFPYHNGEWILLFSPSEDQHSIKLAETIINSIKVYGKQSTSIGISQRFEGLTMINECYNSASRALTKRIYGGGEQVYIED